MSSVADFLREPAIKAGLAGGGKAAAETVLAAFKSRFRLADCINTSQFLAISDVAYRARDFDFSREAVAYALKSGTLLDAAYGKLGRLEAELGHLREALDAFHKGVGENPASAYNWINAALMQWSLGEREAAIASVKRFLDLNTAPHNTTELQLIAEIGDWLFDSGDRVASIPFYKAAQKFGSKRPNVLVRIGEALIAAGDAKAAVEVLRPAEAAGKLDSWGRRALALALGKTAAPAADAIAVARAAALAEPANTVFTDTYIELIAATRDYELLAAELAAHPALFTGPAGAEARARTAMAEGRPADAVAALRAVPLTRKSRLFYVCCEITYSLLDRGELDLANDLVGHLETVGLDETVGTVKIDAQFRAQRWEEAGATLAKLADIAGDSPALTLKRFEHAAFVRDHATTEALLPVVEANAAQNRLYMQPVMRYLAETGRWDDLLDRAIPWLSAEFVYAQIGYLLFRAARRTKRFTELLGAINKIPGVAKHADLSRLRCELLIERAAKPEQLADVARDTGVAKDGALVHRILVRREIAARAAMASQRRALFLCTDLPYLGATAVALHSALARGGLAGADIFLVVGDDVTDPATELADAFRARDVTLRVLPASIMTGDHENLSGKYGLFTSGHRLSSAAYYRIFCARWLATQGNYDRAVYLDSDVLIRRPLSELFAFDIKGNPLAARLEVMRPEVRRAIELHKIEQNRYFNSGVLLFDLRHKELLPCLDRSIAAISDEKTLLLYHDQCALNIGFRGHFTDLDIGFNQPVGEATALASVPEAAAVLHFLDRPKPWSTAYRGDAADLWYDAWKDAAGLIGEPLALKLLAATTE